MSLLESYLTSFQNLKGITIGERRKDLFLLINNMKMSLQSREEIDSLILSIEPKSHLENLFKLELIKYFKFYDKMTIILMDGDVVLTEKIVRDVHFLDHLLDTHTPEELVKSFFPNISYVTRLKILNKLHGYKEISKNNDLFEICLERYNLQSALLILHLCTIDKITSFLKLNCIKLTPTLLLKLAKKDADLVFLYLDEYVKNFGLDYKSLDKYTSVFKFMAVKNPKLIETKRHFYFKLGKRTTNSIMKSSRTDVIEKPHDYISVLNHKALLKSLKDGYTILYYNYVNKLKKEPQPFNYDWQITSLIENLPKKQQVNLYLDSFKYLYNSSIVNYPGLINPAFLSAIDNVEEREFYLELKIKHNKAEESLMQFYNSAKAINLFKEKVRLTADHNKRAKLIQLMVDSCCINKDKEELLEVCQYVIQRHRNDDVAVRSGFLLKLHNATGDLSVEKLDAEHWNCILELFVIEKLNKESSCIKLSLMEKYVLWHFLNNLQVEQVLYEMLKEFNSMPLNVLTSFPQYEKQCLQCFYTIIPKVFMKTDELAMADVRLFLALKQWNFRHCKNQMAPKAFSRLLTSVQWFFDNVEHQASLKREILIYLICSDVYEEEVKHIFCEYYWKSFELCFSSVLNAYLLSNNPAVIYKNIEVFLTVNSLKLLSKKIELNFCKKYSHLGLSNLIVTKCLNDVENEIQNTHKKVALRIISYLMPGKDYMNFVKSYYSPSSQDKCKKVVTNYVAATFKNVNPPQVMLEEMIKFCTKTYFQSLFKSLYSVAYNTPENKLKILFDTLSTGSISNLKHSVHLACVLLSKNEIYELLRKCSELSSLDVNRSFFRTALRLFKQNSTVEYWDLFKLFALKLDNEDTESLEMLIDVNHIPMNYVTLFVEFVWKILDNLRMKKKRLQLLTSIKPTSFLLLSNNFCDQVISDNFAINKKLKEEITTFVVMYLFHFHPNEVYESRLKLVLKIIAKQTEFLFRNAKHEILVRKNMSSFIKEYCEYALNYPHHEQFIKMFSEKWNTQFKSHEFFNDYLMLEVLKIHIESLKLNYGEFSMNLAKLLHFTVAQYGMAIVNPFAAALEDILHICLEKAHGCENSEEIEFQFYKEFAENTLTPACALVVLRLIKCVPLTPAIKTKYFHIITVLKNRPEKIIEIGLSSHLTAVE